MSFLTPLYVLGALTIAAPLIFHLIRRTTRGETPFGSLIFLTPSPPRLTRRSRLENWPLLLLRALALGLTAAAFARPFLRESAALDLGTVEPTRTAVLIDTSASMKRGDLWEKAKARALDAIASARPEDQLAIIAFDASTRTLLGFEESSNLEPNRRRAVATALVEGLAPTWNATRLGQALIDASGTIESFGDAARPSSKAPRRVVLVSDMQQGGRLDALGDFEWPADLTLDVRSVADDGSNASLEMLPPAADPEAEAVPGGPRGDGAEAVRVRVSNAPNSQRESFTLRWDDPKAQPIPVYIPPGESRIVRAPRPTSGSGGWSLQLVGDAHDFDDTVYLAPPSDEAATVVFLGDAAADDPEGPLYYLVRAFAAFPRRSVTVEASPPREPLAVDAKRPPALVVVATDATPANTAVLAKLARQGTTVLVVPAARSSVVLANVVREPGSPRRTSPPALPGSPTPVAVIDVEDAKVSGDVMLGDVAFDHPLFAPFAGPQFNDFTKIRFWKYRKLEKEVLGSARVLARFENHDPAVIEKRLGKGRLVVLLSGWTPADSQLARSSKFAPLLWGLLDDPNADDDATSSRLVGEPVRLSDEATAVHRPDGAVVAIASGTTVFRETDAPGIYTIDRKEGPRPIAVNLDPLEGRTAPLAVETLEQYGCKLSRGERFAVDRESARQMRSAELEGRQKLWRPVVVLAIAVLTVETWLAGRLGRSRPVQEGAPA